MPSVNSHITVPPESNFTLHLLRCVNPVHQSIPRTRSSFASWQAFSLDFRLLVSHELCSAHADGAPRRFLGIRAQDMLYNILFYFFRLSQYTYTHMHAFGSKLYNAFAWY